MEATRVGMGAKWQIKNSGLSAIASFMQTVAGRNVGKGSVFSLGLVYQFAPFSKH